MPDITDLSVGTLALIALVILLTVILKVVDKYLPTHKDEIAVGIRQILANMNGLLQVLDRVTDNNANMSETMKIVGKLQSDVHNLMRDIHARNVEIAGYLAHSSEKLALIQQRQTDMPELIEAKIVNIKRSPDG